MLINNGSVIRSELSRASMDAMEKGIAYLQEQRVTEHQAREIDWLRSILAETKESLFRLDGGDMIAATITAKMNHKLEPLTSAPFNEE
jgi:hypothetical protein